MNCRKCGNQLNENENFCKVCGEAVNNQPINEENQNILTNSQATQTVSQTDYVAPTVNQNLEPNTQELNNQPEQQGYVEQPLKMNTPQQVQYQEPNAEAFQQPIQENGMTNQYVQSPNYNQSLNQNMNQSDGNNNKFMILLIIMITIIVGLSAFIGYKLLSNNEPKQTETDKKNDTQKDPDKEPKKEEDIVTNTAVYESSGYKFTIPNDIKYQVDANGLLSFGDAMSFQASMLVEFMPYSDIKANTVELKSEIEKEGMTVVSEVEKTIGDKEFLLIQINANGQNAIFYVTGVDEFYSAIGLAIGNTTSSYEKALEVISTMIKGAEKTSIFSPEDNENKTPSISVGKVKIANFEIEGVEYPLN